VLLGLTHDELTGPAAAVSTLVHVREPIWATDGLTAMHTAFLPVSLFPAGFGVPLAHAVTEPVRACGGHLTAPTPRSAIAARRQAHIGSNTRLSVPNARL
jgi:hypothetical protein